MNQSHFQVPGQPARSKLYSASSIGVATFFGSWLAGAVLISQNYRRLGDPDAARNALVVGIASTVALILFTFSIVVPPTAERALAHGLQAAQVAVIHLVLSKVQGAALKSHASAGGEFFSRWRALGISLLLLPAALGIGLGLAFLFPTLPAIRE